MLEHIRRATLIDGGGGRRTLIILVPGEHSPGWRIPACGVAVRLYTEQTPQGVLYRVVEAYTPPQCASVLFVLMPDGGARNTWDDRVYVRTTGARTVVRVTIRIPDEGEVTLTADPNKRFLVAA